MYPALGYPSTTVPPGDTIDAGDDRVTINVTARACTEIMPKAQLLPAARIFEIVSTSNLRPRARRDAQPDGMR